MDLGNAIKTIREQKKISAKELAKECGISVNSMCHIETNKTLPRKDTLSKICECLNIPPAYLLFFCITDEDLKPNTRALFNTLYEPIKKILLTEISR